MFTRGGTSIWMRNVQLALFTVPLQALAIVQQDRRALLRDGPLHGFGASTWAVVFIQFAGGMIVAVVIKCSPPTPPTRPPSGAHALAAAPTAAVRRAGTRATFSRRLRRSSRSCAPPSVKLHGSRTALPAHCLRIACALQHVGPRSLVGRCTSIISIPVFNYHPTPVFWLGVSTVSLSIWLYAR